MCAHPFKAGLLALGLLFSPVSYGQNTCESDRDCEEGEACDSDGVCVRTKKIEDEDLLGSRKKREPEPKVREDGEATERVRTETSTLPEGKHLQVGRGELTPSVTARTHWSSNLYLRETDEISGLALLLKPALKFNIDDSGLRLDLEANYGARRYLNSDHQELNSYGETDLAAGIVLSPRDKISVKADAVHSRETAIPEAEYSVTNEVPTQVIHKQASGAIALHPGTTLTLNLGGFGSYDDYTLFQPNSEFFEDLDTRLGYGPEASLEWDVFQRMVLLASYSQTWYDWQKNQFNERGDGSYADVVGHFVAMPNSKVRRAQVGLESHPTERLVWSASVGSVRAIYDETTVGEEAQGEAQGEAQTDAEAFAESIGEGGDHSGDHSGDYSVDLAGFPEALIFRAGIQWSPRPGHTIELGYWKDYQDSWFTNFVQYHDRFFRYDGMLTSRALMGVEGGYRLETYRGEVTRGDHVVRAEGYFTYRTSGWADLSLRGFGKQRASANSDLGLGADQPWIEYDDYGWMFDITLQY